MLKNCLFLINLFCVVAPKAQNVIHKELLGRPTDEGISLQMQFDQEVELCIQYGPSSGNYTHQLPWSLFNSNQPATLVLNQLLPNQSYFYRVCYRKPGDPLLHYRPEYTFHTARPKGEAFTFVIQADPHVDEQSDTAVYLRCLRNQLEDQPDFMIDLGDIFMTDKLKNNGNAITKDTITSRCKLMRTFYENSCHSVPLFMALGNHEGEAGWQLKGTAENIAVWGTNERKKYYLNPYPDQFYSGDTTVHPFVGLRQNYYAWEWGDALFIVLDPYWYTNPKPDSLNGWHWTLGKTQYDWLKHNLERSNAKFKFIFAHQLIGGDPMGRGGVEFADNYEWGGNNLDGTPGFSKMRPGWYKPIKELLKEHRVTVFFHGHDHFFGKQEKDCLIYQETPQPSHPNYQTVNYAKEYGYLEGQILPNSGHLRVRVDPTGVEVNYVRVYLPQSETATRKNKDVSASYFISERNCYDTLTSEIHILWNKNYFDELIYPSPFSDQLNIQFELKSNDVIHLNIYDSKGMVVKTLLNNQKVNSGAYHLIWDGRNNFGEKAIPGMYVYTIQSKNGPIATGKIIIQ